MGLDITYKAGESELSFQLPPGDIEILEFLRKKGFEQEVDIIFGVSGFGEYTNVKRVKLLEAVKHIVDSIGENRNILPYIYSTKEEIPRGSGMYSTGSGVTSGFRIKGEIYSLEAGLNNCILTKLVQDQSGKWRDTEPKDIRNQKIIKIDKNNFSGDIEIKKRKKPTKLIKNLERLSSFLDGTDESTIVKVLG